METVVSGIRPTGEVHLGNYLGAIRNFVRMQEDERFKMFTFIADYHALTTHTEAKVLQTNVKTALAIYLGCGLDPDKAVIYIQSHLPQIPELYLLFNMLAYKGELEKVPTFKEKVRAQEQTGKSINAGLLTYPVLMAVDIVIHRAHKVPVGKDQEAHLEMARNFVNRFNSLFNNGQVYFPEPYGFNYGENLIKVPSLDGTGKMSKSAENPNSAIYLLDEDETIRKKVMRAVTDSGPTVPNQEKPEVIQNLFDLLALAGNPDTVSYFEEQYNNCNIRYGDLKKQLAQDMIGIVAPIRKRIQDVLGNETYLKKVAKQGAEAACESAQTTLDGAKELVGLNYFR